MSKPRQEFVTRWQKEKSFFEKALITDIKTNKQQPWPYQQPTEAVAYENWLKDVVDPTTDEYYKGKVKKDIVEGNTVKEVIEDAEIRQEVRQITRIRTEEGTEYLLTKSNLIGYNEFGKEKRRYISNTEQFIETTFLYETEMDSRTRKLTNTCKGPNGQIVHYEIPFTPANVDKLYAMRDKKRCLLVVKDALSGQAKQCLNLEMFKKQSIDYIMNDDYLGEREKQQRREDFQALQTGLIEARAARK